MSTEKKITSYEDACKALNIKPINEEVFNVFPKEDRKSMIAYHKLTVIVRALNEGWLPDWENTNERKFYPIFRYVSAGLSYANTTNAATLTSTTFGSRLCFSSPALAEYAAYHFADLYRDYYCLPASVEEEELRKGMKIHGDLPQGEFLKNATDLVQKKLVTMVENSKTRGIVLIACDTDTCDENGIESTGVMIGICGNGKAVVKGVMDFLTQENSAPIAKEAVRRIAIDRMKEKIEKESESFLSSILNN